MTRSGSQPLPRARAAVVVLAAALSLAVPMHLPAQSGMVDLRGQSASDAPIFSPVTFDFSPPGEAPVLDAPLELPSRAQTHDQNMRMLERLLAVDDAPEAVSAFLAGGRRGNAISDRSSDPLLSRFLESGGSSTAPGTQSLTKATARATASGSTSPVVGRPAAAPPSGPPAAPPAGPEGLDGMALPSLRPEQAFTAESTRLTPEETFHLSTKVEDVKSQGEFVMHNWNGFAAAENPVAPPPAHVSQVRASGDADAASGRKGPANRRTPPTVTTGGSPLATEGAGGGGAHASQGGPQVQPAQGDDPFLLPDFDRGGYRLGSSFFLDKRDVGSFSLAETGGLAERVLGGRTILSMSSRYRLRDSLRLHEGYAQESPSSEQGKKRLKPATFWTGVLFNF